MNYMFYLRRNFTSQLQKSFHDTSAINLVDFIFYFKEKAKYLATNLNVAKKFSTEDRTYSSSREEISSSFKSAQETSRKERKK